jgi:hypothetical protein
MRYHNSAAQLEQPFEYAGFIALQASAIRAENKFGDHSRKN